ncbi:hypothetical protein [Roseateles koreensis]|uniref:Lipoprotein n=1 Tax=Roseateles koreensis TaxID=2987526 RepID=A0ABT5KQP2_9BURK|nr:hypothetical protein [Roseateles koreensis]MDC8785176.1 hypothetical protein [Roseateles koreensis]
MNSILLSLAAIALVTSCGLAALSWFAADCFSAEMGHYAFGTGHGFGE